MVFQLIYSLYWYILYKKISKKESEKKTKKEVKYKEKKKDSRDTSKNAISSSKYKEMIAIIIAAFVAFIVITITVGIEGNRQAHNKRIFCLSESYKQVVICDDGEKLILADCVWNEEKCTLEINTDKTIVIDKMNFPLERIECNYVKVDSAIS